MTAKSIEPGSLSSMDRALASGDSVLVACSMAGVSPTDEKLIESETNRRKERPIKRSETANFTKKCLCLVEENGLESDLISFAIMVSDRAKKDSVCVRERERQPPKWIAMGRNDDDGWQMTKND